MVYHFVSNDSGMQMDLIIKNLYGTSIQFNEKDCILTERGIFNSLGYTSKHKLEKNIDLQGFITLFDQRNQVSQLQKPDFMKCIITMTDKSMDIQLDMKELYIDIDVRLLMILSTLANTDEKYIKGPQPIIKKEEIRLSEIVREQNRKSNPKKFSLLLKMNKMVGSVSDSTKQKFAIIQSAVLFTMLNYGDKQIEEIAQCIRRKPVNDGINHSSMTATLKNFTVYFSKIKDGKILAKREFLKPMVIDFDQQRFYTRQNDIYILATEIRLKTDELLLSATVKDVLNINKILQDNLKVLDSFKNESDKVKQVAEKQDLHEQLQKIEQNIAREIQSKTKIVGTIAPIQLEIINDCDSNFMPVLRLLIQDTKPAMYQTIISTELFIIPIISLYFFNPRSSRWQPIIEPFKASINYKAITIKKEQSVNINIKTASLQEQTSSLKINVSTQMISTIMATKDIVLAEKQNIDKNIQTKEIQISPFIFHNVTNQKIFLLRGESEFQLCSLFKGPIRLIKTTQIIFRLNNKTHKFSLDHKGVLKIPQSDYFIRFASQKLNRFIKFLPKLVIKNKIQQSIYVKRFGNVPEVPKKVEINDSIPLDNVQSFAFSLNGNSYTQKIQLNANYL